MCICFSVHSVLCSLSSTKRDFVEREGVCQTWPLECSLSYQYRIKFGWEMFFLSHRNVKHFRTFSCSAQAQNKQVVCCVIWSPLVIRSKPFSCDSKVLVLIRIDQNGTCGFLLSLLFCFMLCYILEDTPSIASLSIWCLLPWL